MAVRVPYRFTTHHSRRMNLKQLVVAVDQSDAGRAALAIAVAIARHAGSRLALMTAIPPTVPNNAGVTVSRPCLEQLPEARQQLERWAAGELSGRGSVQLQLDVTCGIPGIEICRCVERRRAGLVVLGRKHRSRATRLLMGDTADAVARRSLVPCLFVPPGGGQLRRLLVALDATPRGQKVLAEAVEFAAAIGASLSAVTVEPAAAEEATFMAAMPLSGNYRDLADVVAAAQTRLASTQTIPGAGQFDVRRGDVVGELLAEVERTKPDALVIGYRRGGPPGMIEAGSVARRLAHTVPCAVVTVPL